MTFDAGILNNFGGGNIQWWHDYIRSLLDAANEQFLDEIGRCENEVEGFEAKNEKLKEALERIQNWRNAYPLDVFPKPDLKKARKVLKDAGMTLDAISADNMRHVLDGIKDIVDSALKGRNNGTDSS